jgi:hypothetical protein
MAHRSTPPTARLESSLRMRNYRPRPNRYHGLPSRFEPVEGGSAR